MRAILADLQSPFVQDLDAFVRSIADAGFVNSLAQTLIKICAPGVPDFYQGVGVLGLQPGRSRQSPAGRFRRPPAKRWPGSWRAAEKICRAACRELLARWPDERIKMFVIWRALGISPPTRRQLFDGDYLPLVAEGPRKAQRLRVSPGTPAGNGSFASCPGWRAQAWHAQRQRHPVE